jgi:hypothetical protein
MAKELSFDEPQEEEAAKQEDRKAILLRWRLEESRKWKPRGEVGITRENLDIIA